MKFVYKMTLMEWHFLIVVTANMVLSLVMFPLHITMIVMGKFIQFTWY